MDVCSFTFLLVIFSYSSAQTNFQIIVNEKTVETLAVQSATRKLGIASRITRTALRRLTICGSEPAVKVEFCRQFLPMAELGLTFGNFYIAELNCEPKTFRVKHLPNEEPDNYTTDMYPCPVIVYNDLTTEKDTSINHKYYVSKGREYNSAVVFIQRNRVEVEEKIYPKYYVKKIVCKKLIPSQQAEKSPLATPYGEKSLHSNFVKFQAIAYDEAKKLDKPYEKFRRTFSSISLCGLRKSHKVHLCRASIRSSYKWYAQLEYDDYDDHLCRRRRIRLAIPDTEGVARSENLHLSVETEIILLLCPRIMSVLDSDDDFVYLSSTLLSDSVFFFTRKNERGEPFVRNFLINKLYVERIDQDRHRARFMLYPTEEQRKEELRESRSNSLQKLEERANTRESSVQMPTMIAKSELKLLRKDLLVRQIVAVNPRKGLGEDALISFSQIKINNLVYSRFRMTHWSLDICQQPKIVRRQLCRTFLSQISYSYDGTLREENIDYRCNKHSVHLRAREIENLQPMTFSMWHCPIPASHAQYNFFIAKCHIKNSALVFKSSRINPDAKIYPDAVVTAIDREYLSTIKEGD